MQLLKKYFSILFLVLFIFPGVQKALHAFEHQDEEHCTSTDKHFHELEHTCSVCDHTLPDTNPPTESLFSIVVSEFSVCYNSSSQNIHIPDAFTDLPSRAPPIV